MSKSLENQASATERTIDQIVETIASTTPDVREAIAEHRGLAESTNPSGEDQLAADLRADAMFEQRLLNVDAVGTYASEERKELSTGEGRLHVTMDPLDGSSNLEPNSGMGSIFAVYSERPPTSGQNLLAAGFVIYGPATSMVLARDGTAKEYIVEDGTRRLVDDDVTIPDDPTVYGFGGGEDSWTDPFGQYANEIQSELKLRYGGAMIADISQVLTYGGIFSYPALQSRPEGKLRLQFEGHPMAYVARCAGGCSSDGSQSLLEKEPDGLHARTPLHIGNESLIERLESQLD